MRRFWVCALLASVAGLCAAQSTGTELLGKFQNALTSAKSLKVVCTVTTPASGSYDYTIELAKPSYIKIDAPTELIVADGSDILLVNKRQGFFFQRKQTDAEFKHLLKPLDLCLWSAFFDAKASAAFKDAKADDPETVDGKTYDKLEFTWSLKEERTVTCRLNPTDGIVRKAEFNVQSEQNSFSLTLEVKSLTVGDKVDPAVFALKAPDGTREVGLDELATFYGNVDTALQVAKNTDRTVMIAFLWDH
jgi:outer membrane lipoprotein-sorting protein